MDLEIYTNNDAVDEFADELDEIGDVDIKVASQETRNIMANKILELRDALEAISIKINSITVVHHA